MIQTADQYVFLYRTLIEGILTMDTNISLQEYLSTKKLRMDTKSQYKVGRNKLKRKRIDFEYLLFEIAFRTITIYN
jgi:hypothetical protein